MKRGAVAFFTKRFTRQGKVTVNYDPNSRLTRVWFSVDILAELLSRNFDQGAHGVSSILSHELAHAFDKQYVQKGDMYDHIRMEGLATFAAAIRQPTLVSIGLSQNYIQQIHRWDSLIQFILENENKGKLAYTLGFVMCIGIVCRRLKKRYNVIYTPFTPAIDILELFRAPKYRKDLEETFRMINNITKKEFFYQYELAVKDNVAPDLFCQEIYDDLQR